jgi:hypothetical protein
MENSNSIETQTEQLTAEYIRLILRTSKAVKIELLNIEWELTQSSLSLESALKYQLESQKLLEMILSVIVWQSTSTTHRVSTSGVAIKSLSHT